MRALLISVLSLSILIGIWAVFYQYSDEQLHHLTSSCENEVMPAIESENWDAAYEIFSKKYKQWHDYQKWALYMLETESINNVDQAFAKTLMYIKAKDLSNSSGELLALKNALNVLQKNESITPNNIL